MLVSIIIRTLNEARYLDELLQSIKAQQSDRFRAEVVLVDSGSTDGTLEIAQRHGCLITHITRQEFSFGRSLNRGCEIANGEILILVSGHCVPVDDHWLHALCAPIADQRVEYSYGRQHSGPDSFFSEGRIFNKYFPAQSCIPQQGFFCNNANSALSKAAWQRFRFDEEVTGLEDMELAQRLVNSGGKVGYVAEAGVYHHHAETWKQVKRRFEREALALRRIMPQIHLRPTDLIRYMGSSIWLDLRHARTEKRLLAVAQSIILYRFWQYLGSYHGNHEHRLLSHSEKDKYFYPGLPPMSPVESDDASVPALKQTSPN